MRITDIILQNGGVDAVRKNAGVNRAQEAKPSAPPARAKDAYVPSQNSQKSASASEAKAVQAHVQAAPDIRQDRIKDVKSKIESGYYNSDEFKDKLADRLIKDFGF